MKLSSKEISLPCRANLFYLLNELVSFDKISRLKATKYSKFFFLIHSEVINKISSNFMFFLLSIEPYVACNKEFCEIYPQKKPYQELFSTNRIKRHAYNSKKFPSLFFTTFLMSNKEMRKNQNSIRKKKSLGPHSTRDCE